MTRPRAAGSLRAMGFRTLGVTDRLRAALGEGLREQELLKHHTTFRVGGPAEWFVAATTQDQLSPPCAPRTNCNCHASCWAAAAICWCPMRAFADWW